MDRILDETKIVLVQLENAIDIEKKNTTVVPYCMESLLDVYLSIYQWDDPIIVSINGNIVQREKWATTYLKPHDYVLFKPMLFG